MVYLPPGEYIISEGIVFPPDKPVVLVGSGCSKNPVGDDLSGTVIKYTGSGNAITVGRQDGTNSVLLGWGAIKNLCIEGSTESGNLIYMEGAVNGEISNVILKKTGKFALEEYYSWANFFHNIYAMGFGLQADKNHRYAGFYSHHSVTFTTYLNVNAMWSGYANSENVDGFWVHSATNVNYINCNAHHLGGYGWVIGANGSWGITPTARTQNINIIGSYAEKIKDVYIRVIGCKNNCPVSTPEWLAKPEPLNIHIRDTYLNLRDSGHATTAILVGTSSRVFIDGVHIRGRSGVKGIRIETGAEDTRIGSNYCEYVDVEVEDAGKRTSYNGKGFVSGEIIANEWQTGDIICNETACFIVDPEKTLRRL